MSVRRRQWVSPSGEAKEAWVVDYRDQHGSRHIKTFARKRDADAHHAVVGDRCPRRGPYRRQPQRHGRGGGQFWLESGEAAGLERATLAAYRQHLELHIVPLIGGVKLSQLTVPLVRGFEDRLRRDGRSAAMVRKARRSLGGILADAQERGLVGQNVVYSLRKNRRSRRADGNGKLKIGDRHPVAGRDARHRRRAPALDRKPPASGRSCSRRSSPACGPRSFAGSHGTTST